MSMNPLTNDSATLLLNAAVLREKEKKASLTFVKHAPLPVDLIEETIFIPSSQTRPLPERRSRTHVPDPNIHHDLPFKVKLKLGECIGHGRSGIVFKAKPFGLPEDEPNGNLPPLVIKFARQHYNKWLLREAWFYEEMQSIQGVAVPWCYGLYTARIPVTSERAFIPWLKGWGLRHFPRRPNIELKECLESYMDYDGKDSDDREELENDAKKLAYFGKFRDQYADMVRQFEDNSDSGQRSTVVAFLVLERLEGPYLPIGESDSDTESVWPYGKPIPRSITKEVYDAYSMIHDLGVTHMDIKRDNILKAPVRAKLVDANSKNDSRSLATAHDCKCRIIDFELSTKSNFKKETLNSDSGQYLERLIDNLPDGDDIGQNDK